MFIGIVSLFGCAGSPPSEEVSLDSWNEVRENADGTSVTMMMWQGDRNINNFMNQFVVPAVKNRYNINLDIVNGQGSTIVSILMNELEAGKRSSNLDLVWINGESFYQLRQLNALFGPFVDFLPNSTLIDMKNPWIAYDFQQSIDGFEVPWGNVQFTMIYDTLQTESPPNTRQELESFVKRHPGKFTIPNDFTGMTFLKMLLIDIAGSDTLYGEFNKEAYGRYSNQLWDFLNRIKSDFWRSGRTFPESVSMLHQLYVNGEIFLTMSNNDAEVDNKVAEGFFPTTSRGYYMASGAIQNTHYLGIPRMSPNKSGAMAVANFLISPEAQLQKLRSDVWGDGSILDLTKLDDEWRSRFKKAGQGIHAPPRDSRQDVALQELAPEYMIRIYEDFRTHVIQQS